MKHPRAKFSRPHPFAVEFPASLSNKAIGETMLLIHSMTEMRDALKFIIKQSEMDLEMRKAHHFMGNALADGRAALEKSEGKRG